MTSAVPCSAANAPLHLTDPLILGLPRTKSCSKGAIDLICLWGSKVTTVHRLESLGLSQIRSNDRNPRIKAETCRMETCAMSFFLSLFFFFLSLGLDYLGQIP